MSPPPPPHLRPPAHVVVAVVVVVVALHAQLTVSDLTVWNKCCLLAKRYCVKVKNVSVCNWGQPKSFSARLLYCLREFFLLHVQAVYNLETFVDCVDLTW